jgi:hypothetical protein
MANNVSALVAVPTPAMNTLWAPRKVRRDRSYEGSQERSRTQHRADHPRRTPAAVGGAEVVDRSGKPGARCLIDGSGTPARHQQ